ncbi:MULTISPECIES: hypothetical protein [Paraburkholderia]|uniref:Uncharacterized protein n=1 Tax=Paraburkholderia podalyriae TaxID=1938811 RepID=A0ABR7PNE1_9BURK|nr:hypothetical protein [Paraburkholderia podalyriae]MBC8747564.1 hypothetical protein [Paraburkholderia podalyriae]
MTIHSAVTNTNALRGGNEAITVPSAATTSLEAPWLAAARFASTVPRGRPVASVLAAASLSEVLMAGKTHPSMT